MRLAIALLLAAVLGGCSSAGEETAAPTPSATPTTTPTTTAHAFDLAFTGPPRLAWVDGSVLRYPDGRTVQLPERWGTTGIVAYAGGYLTSDDRVFEGTVGMERLAADGTVLDRWAGTGPPLVSRDGRVAWVSLVVGETGRTGPTLIHADSLAGGAKVTREIGHGWMPFLTGWFRGRLVYRTWGRTRRS